MTILIYPCLPPNGRRETHAMATEFQVYSVEIIEPGSSQLQGINSLVIPRITIKATKTVDDTRAVPLMRYIGTNTVIRY